MIGFLNHPTALAQTFKLKYAPAPIDNPLKGLVPYQDPGPDQFPHSMEFNYVSLGKLVVGPDRYDWSEMEELLNDVKSRGNQTIVRVFLEYPGHYDAIPKFLTDGGLTVHRYKNTNTAPFPEKDVITPDYGDEKLQKTLKQFIAAWGKKYDGDPRLAYITAGLLGTWGEWHTYPRDDLWASKETQEMVLDAYEAAFESTPVLLRYPAGKDHWNQAENGTRKFGYHDDSFAWATLHTGKEDDDWFFQTELRNADATEKWKKYPIGGEVRPEVWGCCHDAKPCTKKGQSFVECRDALHVTWLMEGGLFEAKPSAERFARAKLDAQKLGYEFTIESVSFRETSPHQLQAKVQIKNTGLAPFYHPGWTIQLRVEDTFVDTKWELTKILPGQSKTFETNLGSDAANAFSIRVPNPMLSGKPLRFANDTQKANGWLEITTQENSKKQNVDSR